MTASNGAGDTEALRNEIRQTRAELGETIQALAARADVKARLKESAAQTRARLMEQAARKTEQVRQQAGQAAAAARASMQDANAAARRNPAPWAAIAGGAVAVVLVILVIRGRRR
jgi:hypothetical protein